MAPIVRLSPSCGEVIASVSTGAGVLDATVGATAGMIVFEIGWLEITVVSCPLAFITAAVAETGIEVIVLLEQVYFCNRALVCGPAVPVAVIPFFP